MFKFEGQLIIHLFDGLNYRFGQFAGRKDVTGECRIIECATGIWTYFHHGAIFFSFFLGIVQKDFFVFLSIQRFLIDEFELQINVLLLIEFVNLTEISN